MSVLAASLPLEALLGPPRASAASRREQYHLDTDQLERFMLAGGVPLVDQPLVHRWTPGLYIRQITIPAGNLQTTRTHASRHPYFVVSGRALIRGPEGVSEVVAPHFGITEPGTRRTIFAGWIDGETGEPRAEEDVVWFTVHAITPEEEAEPDEQRRIDMIERRIIERRELADGKTAHELFRETLAALELQAGGAE